MARSTERKQFLFDIYVTALEGGVDHWSRCLKYKNRKPDPSDPEDWVDDLDGFHAIIRDDDDGKRHTIDIGVIAKGVNAALDPDVRLNKGLRDLIRLANKENDASYIDDELADCIVQFALFGELTYS